MSALAALSAEELELAPAAPPPRAGRLRHPRFLGLRDDKAASEVVRER